jgi:CubicO group peptidase (beta-lactamase class C family)
MAEAGVDPGPALPAHTPDELMKRFGSLPLVHQPGERWLYDSGSDILGVLISRATGMNLEDYLRQRIFAPLDMNDTSFSVPVSKLNRLASSYWTNPSTGEFEIFDGVDDSRWASPPVFESGAGGLVSTVDDLLAIGTMMLKGGKYGSERILSRRSVEVMTTDQITPEQKAVSGFFPGFWDSHGWGFGVCIVTRQDDLAATPGRYGWDGGYGTSWYVDLKEELIGILMTQRLWDASGAPVVLLDFWTSVYGAIDD